MLQQLRHHASWHPCKRDANSSLQHLCQKNSPIDGDNQECTHSHGAVNKLAQTVDRQYPQVEMTPPAGKQLNDSLKSIHATVDLVLLKQLLSTSCIFEHEMRKLMCTELQLQEEISLSLA